MVSASVVIGDVIADKYSIERVVGEGGMGVVYLARHKDLDQRVAIKFLLPEIAQQGMAAERFRREARAAARIRGEHVCRVLDVGTIGSGVPYMVMEYLDGCDLANELERRGRLPPEEAVGYLLEACDAVAEAHAAGIIHRDLKPANLFLATRSDGSRRIKVLDFGVSKSLLDSQSGQHALTVTSSVVGSPLYMSPEQLDSAKDVDRRTDIWALGVVLYELVAGRTPFHGDSIPQLVSSVMHDQPPPFGDLAVTAPDGLEEVVHRALSKPREHRIGSIAEFANALAPFAPRHFGSGVVARSSRVLTGTRSQPIGVDGGPDSSAVFSTASLATAPSSSGQPRSAPVPWAQRTTDRGGRSRWGAGLAALVLFSAAMFGLYRMISAPDALPPMPGGVAQPTTTTQGTPASEPERSAPPANAAAMQAPEPIAPATPTPAPGALTGAVDAPGANPNPPAAPAANQPPAAIQPGGGFRPKRPRPEITATPPEPAERPASESPAPTQPSRGVSDFGGRR